jgi:Tol biopolymer transport system component
MTTSGRTGMKAKTLGLCTFVLAACSAMLPGESLGAVTQLVSVDRATGNATGSSLVPSISGNGRFVAFASRSSRLVAGDTNGVVDIFVRDRQERRTSRVSRSSSGQQANGESGQPVISANGRVVAFTSRATNLAPGGGSGTFVHDRWTGATAIVPTWGVFGRQALSADGRYLVFVEWDNYVPWGDFLLFVWDRESKVSKFITWGYVWGFIGGAPAISGNGRYVAYANGNGWLVIDTVTLVKERVDLNSNEEGGNGFSSEPSINYGGRYVAFTSSATNLTASDSNGSTDVFVRDRTAGTTRRVSVGPGGRQADGNSYGPSISANGTHVAFTSDAGNLASSDQNGVADIFLRNWQTGVTQMLSVSSNATQGDLASESPAINADGRYVTFSSFANDLVSNDFNTTSDVFVRDRGVLP